MDSQSTTDWGTAARAMIAQDARWIADASLSLRDIPNTDAGALLAPVLLGHSSRIVYEGSALLRSTSSGVGCPELAALLTETFAEVIARARHAGKLLDDSKKSFTDLQREVSDFYSSHRAQFTGNSVWFARWLETDLGLTYTPDKRVITSTLGTAFRAGVGPSVDLQGAGETFFGLAAEQGGCLAVLSAAAGDPTKPRATVDYAALGPLRTRDVRAERYLVGRYDTALPVDVKLLVLIVEAEINSTSSILQMTAGGHDEPTFRARVVSTYHSLRAIAEILDAYPAADASASHDLRALIGSPDAAYLLTSADARRVRNRCMHYEFGGASFDPDPSQPMFGIVDHLAGCTLTAFDAKVRRVADELAALLSRW